MLLSNHRAHMRHH